MYQLLFGPGNSLLCRDKNWFKNKRPAHNQPWDCLSGREAFHHLNKIVIM